MKPAPEETIAMTHESKVRAYYDAASECYERLMGDSWHHGDPDAEAAGKSVVEACQIAERKFVQASGLKSGGWALDFGSGVGGPTVFMAKESGAHFVGLSNNEIMSEKARTLAASQGVAERVSFLTVGDLDYQHLPFPEGTFDAVFFYESVCHLPDKAAFFREAHRVLKPGGRLVAMDWVQRPFGEHRTEEQIMKFMQPVNEHICIPWHGTIDGYRKLMEAAGFVVTEARDMFEGRECWGSTPPEQRDGWLQYDGANAQRFVDGKIALDNARRSGVFSVAAFVAEKR